MSDTHPELRFTHEYVEEFAHFAGRGVWIAGLLVEHEELDPLEVAWVEWERFEALEPPTDTSA